MTACVNLPGVRVRLTCPGSRDRLWISSTQLCRNFRCLEKTHPPVLLFRYCLEKEDAADYVLCDAIGQPGGDNQWKRECFRVVGDHERPLLLQSLWKPKEGFSRRFEIQLRANVEEQSLKDRDTVTAGTPPPPRPPALNGHMLCVSVIPDLSAATTRTGSGGNKSCSDEQEGSVAPLLSVFYSP